MPTPIIHNMLQADSMSHPSRRQSEVCTINPPQAPWTPSRSPRDCNPQLSVRISDTCSENIISMLPSFSISLTPSTGHCRKSNSGSYLFLWLSFFLLSLSLHVFQCRLHTTSSSTNPFQASPRQLGSIFASRNKSHVYNNMAPQPIGIVYRNRIFVPFNPSTSPDPFSYWVLERE